MTSPIQCVMNRNDLYYLRKMILKNLISNNPYNSSIHNQVIKY